MKKHYLQLVKITLFKVLETQLLIINLIMKKFLTIKYNTILIKRIKD